MDDLILRYYKSELKSIRIQRWLGYTLLFIVGFILPNVFETTQEDRALSLLVFFFGFTLFTAVSTWSEIKIKNKIEKGLGIKN